jgi:hypothetical protein
MKTTLARRYAVLMACAGLGFSVPALAQDKTVKIGVLNDMSSLYADIGGPNSVVAIKMAVEDSGLAAKGWKIDVLSGDHQNKPDIGVNIAPSPIRRIPASRSPSAISSKRRMQYCSIRAPRPPISPARPARRTRSPSPMIPTCWQTAPARR